MKIKLTAILFLMFSMACQTPSEPKVSVNKNLERVKSLYNKAEKLQLPIVWENTSNEYPTDKGKHIRLDEADAIIFGSSTWLTLIGLVADTSNFYTFLFSYPADDTRPLLITLDKQGQIISQLLSGYSCGANCGFYCVGARFTLNKDYTFVSHHTSYNASCVDNDSRLDTSKVTYTVLEKLGSISRKGKIKEKEDIVVEKRTIPFSSKENPIEYFE